MRILVLHNALDVANSADVVDVLVQRNAVLSALEAAGIEAHSAECDLDLNVVRREVENYRPDVVFNLVESLGGTDRLMLLLPLLLDALQVPYTGATSAAILATGSKSNAKQRMRQAGLPTPDWCINRVDEDFAIRVGTRWIIKPIWEHASFGMDDDSVFVAQDRSHLFEQLDIVERRAGRPMLAERYIEGREFNLSLLAGEVLPPAEIDFRSFPSGKPRIVGHAAKWKVSSFEYQQTPRRFRFPASDAQLLVELSDLALRCWDQFGLTGFARVDFRVDLENRPWILEINVNPCLSPDAGFAAALAEAGIEFGQAIQQIVEEVTKTQAVTIPLERSTTTRSGIHVSHP